jgi:hypothetical protein
MQTVSALLDYHPFSGSFRLSAGAFYNGNELNATGKTTSTYEIGNNTYTGTQIGTLTGSTGFNKFAPYLGLGWDTSFGKGSGWGFVFDAGALFQGSPNVKLSASGPISNDQDFQRNLAIEQSKLNDDLDNFKVYPYVALGVTYRF